ncbi:hypothetical protein [Xanthomonas sp. LMG 12461]|uniref:hypothetical protein n=1 Tax=Xanthomonas sp. LMG 12461 TaxID=2014543 RepID=UPI001264A110|nr:hypothetical protein [Xanthomonas sp. LMG 12461]KAB7765402.1 hypothetical protein CEK68_11955 [Xanthomonas sp. LMG 12461]
MANALADFLGGYQAGNEITQQQRQQRQQNQLTQLAPQIVSGDPQAYAQAAAINPQAAQQYQAGGDEIARRARGAAKFLQSALQSGNQQQIMAARQTIKPFMDTLKPGSSYPLDLDPQQEMAGIQGFLAQTSYLDPDLKAGTPTGFREFQMKAAAAGLQPGTPEYQSAAKIALGQEARQSSAAIGYQKMTINGQDVLVATDPRGIGSQIVGSGTSYGTFAKPAVAGQGASAVKINIDGLPPETQQEVANTVSAMQAANLPQSAIDSVLQLAAARGSENMANNPFAGRPQEQQAAATEAAKQAVQLQYLPAMENVKTNAAIQQAGGTAQAQAQAKQQAEVQQQQQTRARDARDTLSLLDQAEKLLPGATGGRAGNLGDTAAAMFGVSTPGAQATAQLQTIAGQLTSKMPRMQGPQSDRDVQLYQQMAGDLANPAIPVATRMAALKTIRQLNQKYAGGAQQAGASGGRTIVRTGTLPDGRKVVQYSDGTTDYGN